jgi:hypothetical protein
LHLEKNKCFRCGKLEIGKNRPGILGVKCMIELKLGWWTIVYRNRKTSGAFCQLILKRQYLFLRLIKLSSLATCIGTYKWMLFHIKDYYKEFN